MPRNPNKTRCQVPGCRNWAMRDHSYCRAHRDAELGPRGAGAPVGNLNALKHGRYSRPLPPAELDNLASTLVAAIVEQPDDLPLHIGRLVQVLQARTGDPFLALVALGRLIVPLRSAVAARLFELELREWLESLPAPARRTIEATFAHYAPRTSPEERLRVLRKAKKRQRNN